MLGAVDRVLAWVGWALAALVVLLLFAGPSLVGADRNKAYKSAPATANGKAVFVSNCGTCHTLKAAGTSGTVGPDLDKVAPEAVLVEDVVANGVGSMPAFGARLSDAEIRAVAQYVAQSSGG